MRYGKRRIRRKTLILRGFILVIIIIALLFLARLAGNMAARNKNKHLQHSDGSNAEDDVLYGDGDRIITVNGKWYRLKDNVESFLIMGIDEADKQTAAIGGVNGNQADFIAVAVVDHDRKCYSTISLNRDTMTKVPVRGVDGTFIEWQNMQLALAHAYGSGMNDSCENVRWAVSELLYQVPIAHYASFSMPAVGLLNDAVGGVTVTINDDFSGVDPSLEMGKTVTLTAEQANTFIRARGGMAVQTNINRMSRQKQFMQAFHKKAEEKMRADNSFALQMIFTVAEYMVSDMSAEKLSRFANDLLEYRDMGQIDIRGESVRGEEFAEFHIDEDDLRSIVLSLYYDEVEKPQ